VYLVSRPVLLFFLNYLDLLPYSLYDIVFVNIWQGPYINCITYGSLIIFLKLSLYQLYPVQHNYSSQTISICFQSLYYIVYLVIFGRIPILTVSRTDRWSSKYTIHACVGQVDSWDTVVLALKYHFFFAALKYHFLACRKKQRRRKCNACCE
jgi:hypothetical protein